MKKRIIMVLAVLLAIVVIMAVFYQHFKWQTEQKNNLPFIAVYLLNSEISAIYDDGEKLWVGGRDGLFWLDRQTADVLPNGINDIDMTYAGAITATDDGIIWVGHNNGLSGFSKSGKIIYQFTDDQIPGGRINCLFIKDHSLWVGGQNGAAELYFKQNKWQVKRLITEADGLSESTISVITANQDNIWFGTYLCKGVGGICILTPNQWQYISIDQGLAHRFINAILVLPNNDVLVATGHLNRGGLSRLTFSENRWQVARTWQIDDGTPGEKTRWLYLDQSDRLWITSESDGLLICSLQALDQVQLEGVYLKQEQGLSDNEIKVILETDQYLWLGGKMGLNRIDKQALKDYLTNNINN